jgi:acyl carrier protein
MGRDTEEPPVSPSGSRVVRLGRGRAACPIPPRQPEIEAGAVNSSGTLQDRLRSIVAHVLQHRLAVLTIPQGVTLHDLCIDAIERVYITDSIEREWDLDINESEIHSWQTIEDIAHSIRRNRL